MKKGIIIIGILLIAIGLSIQIYNDQNKISTLNKKIALQEDKINSQNKEIKQLKDDKEDVIPIDQYVSDIDYLESVILELRGEFERECRAGN